MQFSIIIPTYNPKEKDLTECVYSAVSQEYPKDEYEVLLVDDCSTNWFQKRSVAPDDVPEITTFFGLPVYSTKMNGGPGAARNLALSMATGEWVLFLDSDDVLQTDALRQLAAFIAEHPDADAVGYGWDWIGQICTNQRKDGECLALPKREMLKEYLRLHMDGSVVFTAVKRSLFEDHLLFFRHGLHEDIDFIFDVYRHAIKTGYLPKVLYHKRKHSEAVTSSITQAHVDGFFEGWNRIGMAAAAENLYDDYEIGTVGVIATRAREVCWKAANTGMMEKLKASVPETWRLIVKHTRLDTMYARAAKQFLFSDSFDPVVFNQSWSCHDLQNSLFLAPDEVRTCCKRFFKEGEIRGDVKLVDSSSANPDDILAAKQHLVLRINKGEETPCTGCPFMEFKEWGPVAPLRVQHLSMEHHSVCNMECSYCDETYYGRKQPQYDVAGLLCQLYTTGALSTCQSVVWGGGEPVLGKKFPEMVAHVMGATAASQRFLTNATVFSPAIANAVRSGRGTVTTSVDAGTEKKFEEVRKTDLGMHRVLDNLHEYAAINPQAVTVKYILTDDNIEHEELKNFKEEIVRHGLTHCNFQISCNFKQPDAVHQAIAALQLFAMLREAGCRVVFLDDLLMRRLTICGDGLRAAEWMRLHYADVRAWPEYTKVVVWGTGGMTDWTIEHTDFFKQVGIVARNRYVPGTFNVITGSQGYADNYRKALAAGVPEDMIVKGVIL